MLTKRLSEVRRPLLALHRATLDATLVDYERRHGRVESAGQKLDLVKDDPFFAWLRPISSLIVRIDEALDDEDTVASTLLLAEARRLLAPAEREDEFGRRYVELLQASPDVVMAHAALRSAIERPTIEA